MLGARLATSATIRAAIIAYGTLLIASSPSLPCRGWFARSTLSPMGRSPTRSSACRLPRRYRRRATTVAGSAICRGRRGRVDRGVHRDRRVRGGARVFAFAAMAEWLPQAPFDPQRVVRQNPAALVQLPRPQPDRLFMIRATDDVERCACLWGRGFCWRCRRRDPVGTLIILFWTNVDLTSSAVDPAAGRADVWCSARCRSRVFRCRRACRTRTPSCKRTSPNLVIKAPCASHNTRRLRPAWTATCARTCGSHALFVHLPLVFLIANLGQVVLYAASRLIVDGNLTLGEWQQFSLYLVYVFFPLGNLGFISLMSQAAASAERIFGFLTRRTKPRRASARSRWGRCRARRLRERVVPLLPHGETLKDVSFEAKPGQMIALSRDRQRQDDHHQSAAALLRRDRGPRADRR